MKATKLLGSVALTAALAMGTVPAFASVNAPSDWENGTDQGIGGAGVSVNNKMITNLTTDSTNNNHKTGTGSTAVKASVFDADMQVTIPLQLSVAFASIGSELTCPSDGAYNIINNGDKPVKITHINATGSGFTLGDYDTTKTALAGSGSATRNIAMLLDCGTDKVVDLNKAVTASGDLASVDTYGKSGTKIGDIPIPANTPLAIKLSGTTNKFSTPLAVGYQMATIMTITYTVETA